MPSLHNSGLEVKIDFFSNLLEDCQAPENLRDIQWVDLFRYDGWSRLIKALEEGVYRRNQQETLHKPQMIKTKSELMNHLKSIGYNKPKETYRIAVEALIFTPYGRIILEKRGKKARDEVGKLEGVGGAIGEREDLHEALYSEIRIELGSDVKVKIDHLLEIRQVSFKEVDKGLQDWVVVPYLCRLMKGKPISTEPNKIESLHELTLDELNEIEEAKLSRSTSAARIVYQKKYGNYPYYFLMECDNDYT